MKTDKYAPNDCPVCGKLPKLIELNGNYNLAKYPKTNGQYSTFYYECRRNNHSVSTKKIYLSKESALNGWNNIK